MTDVHSAVLEDTVSVIIPTFNSAETIERALKSVIEQDYRKKEIFIVDDGSTDNTLGVLNRYSNSAQIVTQKNAGPSVARNKGILLSKGQFVAFLDSDDFWVPGFLSRCIAALQQAPDAVAVSVMTRAVHWRGEETVIPNEQPKISHHNVIDDFFPYWSTHDHIRTGSAVVNLKNLSEKPLFRENLRVSEDLEYWAYLATLGKWLFIPEVLFVTDGRHVSKDVSWKQKNAKRRENCPTVDAWQERIVSRIPKSEFKGFRDARGRIARNLAHMKILARRDVEARQDVLTYGSDFPPGKLNKLMVSAARAGFPFWQMITTYFRFREWLKSILVLARTIPTRNNVS